ncbi:MAG: redoxin domain-containing protein, partial [Verrucomicrobiota bacterium]|nr:redoxin domain-containing protein [Verrucomicrobiota bacterium]
MIRKNHPALALCTLALGFCLTISAASAAPAPQSAAPGWQLQDLQGKSVKLSDFKGKVVLLNFWAT